MKYVKPAWVYEKRVSQEKNLFSLANIETNYNIYTYFCHCGRTEEIVDISKQNYKCKCGNRTFLNITKALKNFKEFVSSSYHYEKVKIDFHLYYKIDILDNKVQAICYAKFPINFNTLKYSDKEVVIASAVPNKNNTVMETPKEYSREIKSKLKIMIENREEFEKYIDIKLSRRGSKDREKQIYFFINHYNLKEKEFFKWKNGDLLKGKDLTIQKALIKLANDKKCKSVKKAIYKCYTLQIRSTKIFNPLLIYIATSRFNDPNFIVSTIELTLINNDKYLNNLNRYDLLIFFDFLLKTYTQKQIYYFLKNFDDFIKINRSNFKQSHMIFKDIINQYKLLKNDLKNYFRKGKCTPLAIHDEFVRILNSKKHIHLQSKILNYTDEEYNALVNIKEYEVKLPKNAYELYCWADELNNCLASYLENIKNKLTIVYGFFRDGKLQFAVEIKNRQIIQAAKFRNYDLSAYETKILSDWFENIYSNYTKI